MIKCVLFDFDGVIAESVDVKTRAFKVLFQDRPECLEAITRFHIDNGGMSRYDKFRYIYKNMFREELNEEKFKQLCEGFSRLVVDEVVAAPFVKGVKEVLDKCLNRYKMFVVSGTPFEEMREIIKQKGLTNYFAGVFGSPAAKAELIRGILKENSLNADEAVFVGDSINDFKAAEETGLSFIARDSGEGALWLSDRGVKVKFKDFADSKKFFKSLEAM